MPGAITHIIAGFSLSIIGIYYYKSYFNDENKYKKILFITFICIAFSIIPDIFLITYYITNLFTFCTFIPYHDALHRILFVAAIIGLIFIHFSSKIKNKPIWTMGMFALILHFIIDLILPDINMWF